MLRAIYESVADRAAMHLAPLVGIATALVADFFFASNARTQLLIALGVAIVTREAIEWSHRGTRSACKHAIGSYVRDMLDTPLSLTRFDRVHAGDYLTLRRIASRARAGGIGSVVAGGGPARDLADTVDALSLSFESEVGRCYGKLYGRDQARIDAFATALKTAAANSRASVSPPFDETYEARVKAMSEAVAGAFVATVDAGDALDAAFDPKGHRDTTVARASSDRAQRAEEWDAGEVLLVNARAAERTLYFDGTDPGSVDDVDELAKRIRAARDVGLHVDAGAYGKATDEVRGAHHRIVYDDLFVALELVENSRRNATDDGSIAKARDLVARVSPDVEVLQQRCAALPGMRPN
jgi:hypothetical protein